MNRRADAAEELGFYDRQMLAHVAVVGLNALQSVFAALGSSGGRVRSSAHGFQVADPELGTFEDLQSASTVEELWAVLIGWHGIRCSSVWEEPYLLFLRFHRHDSTNADMTAAAVHRLPLR